MDGLLFDTECLYQKYWLEVADEFGVERSPDLGKECCGTSGEYMRQIVHRFYPGINVDAYCARVVEKVEEELEREIITKPGVREILRFFRDRHIPTAVASSSPVSVIQKNLAHAGLQGYFDAIVGGDQIVHGKPAPDIFLLAAEKLGVPAAECYVFEDGFNGIRAGSAAGCAVVMIPDTMEPTKEIRSLCTGIYPNLAVAMEAIQSGRE